MRLLAITAGGLVALAACQPTPPATSVERLPLLGGYRDKADQCVRVGKTSSPISS